MVRTIWASPSATEPPWIRYFCWDNVKADGLVAYRTIPVQEEKGIISHGPEATTTSEWVTRPSPPSSPQTDPRNSNSNNSNPPWLIGTIVGIVIGILLIATLGLWFGFRYRRIKKIRDQQKAFEADKNRVYEVSGYSKDMYSLGYLLPA